MKEIQVCSFKGPCPLQRWDNHKNVKMGWGPLKILILRNKAEFYMKTFWHRRKASWLKSCAPEHSMGQMEMKCISHFYVGQGYSGERCGPWASCIALWWSPSPSWVRHYILSYTHQCSIVWYCRFRTAWSYFPDHHTYCNFRARLWQVPFSNHCLSMSKF